MPEAQRDDTQDWLLPAAARPVTMLELEQRVDVALAIAKSAEATAVEIGAAAFDAADQARRAAEVAERAVGLNPSAPAPAPNGDDVEAGLEAEAETEGDDGAADEWLRQFSARADRVMVRLRALEPAP